MWIVEVCVGSRWSLPCWISRVLNPQSMFVVCPVVLEKAGPSHVVLSRVGGQRYVAYAVDFESIWIAVGRKVKSIAFHEVWICRLL